MQGVGGVEWRRGRGGKALRSRRNEYMRIVRKKEQQAVRALYRIGGQINKTAKLKLRSNNKTKGRYLSPSDTRTRDLRCCQRRYLHTYVVCRNIHETLRVAHRAIPVIEENSRQLKRARSTIRGVAAATKHPSERPGRSLLQSSSSDNP